MSGTRAPGPPASRILEHVQGLRGVAILLVVAYHMGLALPGGFAGVDVFFVISGYVITRLMIRTYAENGTISLTDFWAGRFRRLAPAAGVVLVSVAGLALLFSSPFDQQKMTGWTSLGAVFSSSNVVIASSSGNYFDPPAELNPLLHFWSLSVEQQFYFVAPVLALLVIGFAGSHPLRKRRMICAWTAIFGTSFLLAIFSSTGLLDFAGSAVSTALGFYSPVGRLWEFGVGAFIAIPRIQLLAERAPSAVRFLFSALGLGAILSYAGLLTSTESFPSPYIVIPVFGAALVIAFAGNSLKTEKFLAKSGLSFLGNHSYSFYLWHWPLLVFARNLFPGSELATWSAVALALLLAVVTFRVVETPFRRSKLTFAKIGMFTLPPVISAVGLLLISTLVLIPAFENGTKIPRYQGQIAQEIDFYDLSTAGSEACDQKDFLVEWKEKEQIGPCFYDGNPPNLSIAVIGDSHSWAVFPGIRELSGEKGTLLLPVSGGEVLGEEIVELSRAITRLPSIKHVYFAAFWSYWGLPSLYLAEATKILGDAGIKVLLLEDVPNFPFDAQNCKYQVALIGQSRCTMPSASLDKERKIPSLSLQEFAENEEVHLILSLAVFCDKVECSMTSGQNILYFDDNHLNPEGARMLFEALLAQDSRVAESLRGAPG